MEPEILKNSDSFGAIAIIILLSFLGIVAGTMIYSRPPFNARILTPVLLAIALNVGVLVFRILTTYYLVADEITWHDHGLLVAQAIAGEIDRSELDLASGKEGYPWLVGWFYFLAGPVPLIPIVLNIVLYALLVPILAVTTGVAAEELRFTETQGARSVLFAAYFIALAPTIVFWVPRMLRETISMFLIGFSVMCVLLFLRNKRALYILGALAAVALMFTIRAQVGAALAAGLVMGMAIAWSLNFRGVITRTVVVVPIFLVIFFSAWRYADTTRDLSVENTTYRSRALANASSSFAGAEEVQAADSMIDIVLFNFPRVSLGPFPHELNFSPVMLLAAASNIFWLFAVFLAIRIASQIRQLSDHEIEGVDGQERRWKAVLVLVAITVTLTFMLSISSGNYGLVIRQRLMPFVVLIPLAGIGYALVVDRRRREPRCRKAGPQPTYTY